MSTRTAFLLLFCSAAAAAIDLTSLSMDETQNLLADWRLHEQFGEAFRAQGYDGRFLHVMTADDYSSEIFPQASKAHWKILQHEVNQLKNASPQSARRLQSGGKFLGLNIAMDNAIITFGKKKDISLKRTAPGTLTVTAAKTNLGNVAATKINLAGIGDLKDKLSKLGGGGGGVS